MNKAVAITASMFTSIIFRYLGLITRESHVLETHIDLSDTSFNFETKLQLIYIQDRSNLISIQEVYFIIEGILESLFEQTINNCTTESISINLRHLCLEEESNLHASQHEILSLACLPFHHQGYS
jgi:hypothetical protein